MVGVPVLVWIQRAFVGLGVPFLIVWLGTIVGVGLVAKREKEWLPDEAVRRKWARTLVIGSSAVALLIAWFVPRPPPPPGSEPAPAVRPRGPAGK